MNALGISLAWTAVQVTVFCIAATAIYLVARRRAMSTPCVLCGTLVVTVGITALSVCTWPRWWTVDLRPTVKGTGPIAPAASLAAKPAPTAAAGDVVQDVDALAVNERIYRTLSRMWRNARDGLADALPAEQGRDRWRWTAWLALAMLSGMSIGVARVLLGAVALAKLLCETRRVNDQALLGLVEELRTRLRCRRPVEVREMTCQSGGSPAVVGWRRPIILLPADWRSWSDKSWRGILAHEMAHVAHGDFLMGLVAQAGVVVHFYNPLVHWLAGRLRLEQELAADACGAALACGAKAYANLLAQMALAQNESLPLWAGRPFFPTRGTLMRRIEMLRSQQVVMDRPASPTGIVALVTILVLVGLGISGLRGPAAAARADELPGGNEPAESASTTADGRRLPAFDDAYLPADAIAVVSVKPLKVANSTAVIEPCLAGFPSAVSFTFSTAGNGVDEIKAIVFRPEQGQASSTEPQEPAVMGIYRMQKPYERSKLRVQIFGEAPDGVTETTFQGHPCFRATSNFSGALVNYLLVDDRTIVTVRDRDVPRLLEADPNSHPSWYGEWQKIAGRPLAIGFDSAAMDALDEPKGSAEEMFFSVLKNTSHFFGSIDSTAEGLLVSGRALCKSSEAALEVSQSAKAVLALARMAAPQALPAELPKEYEGIDISGRLTESLSILSIETEEARIDLQGKLDAAFVVQVAEATKAFIARQTEEYKAREPADEQAHIAKLDRLAAAMNAYHADHGHYPPAAVVGRDGKTLHSWRVELLPYLGEQELFQSYKLDQPWDSEHNKPLVEKIPSIFSTSVWTQKGHSDYFVITGKGTLFDADEVGRRESVADAPGETILVLQSNQHVPWTKPVDVETTADHNTVRPFRGHGKGFYAAFADGTIKFVSKETDAASVRAMFTKAGGDEVKLR